MGLNSYKKKIDKILSKKGFYNEKLSNFIIDNINKKDIDSLISDILKLDSLGHIISTVNKFSSTGEELLLNSGHRVRKFRRTTKKVSLQMMVNKDLKKDFDSLKEKYNYTSEELLSKLLYNTTL